MSIRNEIAPLLEEFQRQNGRGNVNGANLMLLKIVNLLVDHIEHQNTPNFVFAPAQNAAAAAGMPITQHFEVPYRTGWNEDWTKTVHENGWNPAWGMKEEAVAQDVVETPVEVEVEAEATVEAEAEKEVVLETAQPAKKAHKVRAKEPPTEASAVAPKARRGKKVSE